MKQQLNEQQSHTSKSFVLLSRPHTLTSPYTQTVPLFVQHHRASLAAPFIITTTTATDHLTIKHNYRVGEDSLLFFNITVVLHFKVFSSTL